MKKKKDYVLRFLFISFCLFLILYVTQVSGLVEYKAYQKAKLTSENIKRFEDDISNGKNVTIEDYVVDNYKDYSNIVSDTGYTIGYSIEKFMNLGIKKTLKTLSALFYE